MKKIVNDFIVGESVEVQRRSQLYSYVEEDMYFCKMCV